jgi:hypothetical protein
MKYILIGLLVSIGWHLAKFMYEIMCDMIVTRLHKAKWYNVATGRIKNSSNKNKNNINNKIGF